MAAMSTAAPTTATLTPPSSAQGKRHGFNWDFSSSGQTENHVIEKKTPPSAGSTNGPLRSPLIAQNGNAAAFSLDTTAGTAGKDGEDATMNGTEPKHGSEKRDSGKDTNGPIDGSVDLSGHPHHRSHKRGQDHRDDSSDDEASKWIHRDKLARIENEELQAAGIILPHGRARRRERSLSSQKRAPHDHAARVRKDSTAVTDPKTPDGATGPSWDLRLPEEAENTPEGDPHFQSIGGPNGVSRIPVAKTSPMPIPSAHLERETPMIRKRESSPGDEERRIEMPKTRARANSNALKSLDPSLNPSSVKRSATDVSPKKNSATGARKSSAPAKSNYPPGRAKTRGATKDSTSSTGTRPSTRSGERELSLGSSSPSRPMEGDPPWMISAYKPDPRLPPDQQLLPTVARRLQQEKWEREGKFGSIYDKEFRPLTDEGFLEPPPAGPSSPTLKQDSDTPEEWPLKPDPPKSPVSPARTNSYSTMPKINDMPPVSPLASPRTPVHPHPPEPTNITRLPDPEKADAKEKGGCGCCIVM